MTRYSLVFEDVGEVNIKLVRPTPFMSLTVFRVTKGQATLFYPYATEVR